MRAEPRLAEAATGLPVESEVVDLGLSWLHESPDWSSWLARFIVKLGGVASSWLLLGFITDELGVRWGFRNSWSTFFLASSCFCR